MAKCITCMIIHMLIQVYILYVYFIYIFLHMCITGLLYMYYKCISCSFISYIYIYIYFYICVLWVFYAWVTCLIYHTFNTHVTNYLARFISKGIKYWKLYFFLHIWYILQCLTDLCDMAKCSTYEVHVWY